MGEAREFGLKSGVSFPIHSAQGEFAMLNLASSKNHVQAKPSILEVMPYASLFSAYLHEAVAGCSIIKYSLYPGCILPNVKNNACYGPLKERPTGKRHIFLAFRNAPSYSIYKMR